MMPNDGASVVTEQAVGLSQMERVLHIFTAPTKTFRDILRNTSWWAPFLLLVVMSLLSAVVIDKQVGFDTVVQNALHDTPKIESNMAELEPKARAAQIHMMSGSYRYTCYGSPILLLLVTGLGSLVLWGALNFALGTKTTYKQIFAVWMYASLPRLIAAFLVMVTLLSGGSAESFNINNPIGTNLGFYVPDAAPWIKMFLSFFDVIGLWVLALMVIGTAAVAGIKRNRAAMVVVTLWLIVLVLSVVGSVLRS
jgi:hypothetical protein